ncbi:hypothetical protein CW745_15630, partial [Psychromonas sp. psych-6C06]|uniref:Calx-beta domain-containing protein n=1 Tax=Psychromonas sp. psych-6C06 TaxID=2058089 RepID=UPI000CC5AF9E
MSDNVNNNEDQLKESQNEADLIENTNGILTEPNLIEDEVLAEIEAIQAAIAEDETPIEEIETAAGENSDGGSSSAVDFTRDGSETLASTDFQTASFAFNAVTNEFIDTNNFVLTTTNNADTSGSTPSIIGTTTSPSSPIVPSADSSLSAQFTDNFVSGVSYNTSSGLSGFTGDTGTAGEFKYNIGDVITFKVGDVIIAEFNADAINGDILFLQDISGHDLTENNASHIENMAIFLQGLDSDLSDSNSADGILRTDSLVNNEASYATNITISEAIHEAFINYIDPTTGLPLDITSSGKEMISQALASVGIEFTRDTERDESGENTFESIAMEHVTETIQELAGDRTPEQADEREIDTIEVPGGLINFNFQEADGVITFTTDDLLVGAIGQQVITANLLVDNVRLSAAFENIGTLVDNGDGNYEIQLNEGVTGKELEGLAIDYRVEDWTVSKEVTSQTLDSFKSHLSANIEDVQEDAGFNQFTLNSTLSFQQDSQLQINFSSELLSQQLTAQITQELADLGKTAVTENGVLQIAEYADDFTVPLEYSNDGGVTWTAMTVVSIDTTGNIPRPIFGFELASGNSSVEIRVPIFDDVTEEPTEYFRAEITGDNFYDETIVFAIEDNDSVASVLPQIDIDYVLITEGQGEAIFTLTLSEKSDDVITVEYDTAELSAKFGVDFEATSGIAIFQPGQTTAEIKIAIVDDLISEISPEFALINLSNATNAVINDAQGTLRIFDNDYPVNLSVSSPEVNEGEQAVFTVNIEKELGGKPESLALVNLSLSNGTAVDPQDFDSSTLRVFYGETSNPQYLDFDGRGNVILPIGVTSLTVIVDTVNDSVFEQPEDFSLTVKVANAQATGNVTILDNDTNLAPTLTAENGQMDEDGGSVTVKFEAKDTDGTIVSTVATVPAEQGTVVVNDDGTYTFTPVKDFNGEATITLVTEDSEGATSSTTSKVVVNAINDKPSEIVLDNLTVNENDIGAVIGKLSTTDVDDGDSHTYTVDDNRFEVVNGELKLKEGISLDHETQDSIVVKVTSTDSGQLSTEQSFTIA